ncbi:VanW family protein [Psychrobacillus sp. NPDC096426]|uniref:VanW family protein n=1 Tax=Psychrobacillus sp. NPDC096426 TaxID=3364491 RepID=UPI00381C3C4A
MEQKNSLQFILLMTITSVLLIVLTFGIYKVANAFTNGESDSRYFEKDTWIGPIAIDGLSKEQATQLVAQKTNLWALEQNTSLQFIFEESTFTGDIIDFLVEESIQQAKSGERNRLFAKLNEANWETSFAKLGLDEYIDLIDENRLESYIVEQASILQSLSNPIHVTDYFLETNMDKRELSRESIGLNASSFGVSSWIQKHGIIQLETDQTFSLNELFQADTDGLYNAQFQNELSSLLYKVALNSPLSIVERHVTTDNQYGREIGFEAYIDGNHNLVLKNQFGHPISIQSTMEENKLSLSIYGKSTPIEVLATIDEQKELTPRVIIRPIELDQQERKVPGKNGTQAMIKRVVLLNDSPWKTYDVSLDSYLPIHEVWYKFNENLLDSSEGTNAAGNGSTVTPPTRVTEDKGYEEVDPEFGDGYVGK